MKKLLISISCLMILLTSCVSRSSTIINKTLNAERIVNASSYTVDKFVDGDSICYVACGGTGVSIFCK